MPYPFDNQPMHPGPRPIGTNLFALRDWECAMGKYIHDMEQAKFYQLQKIEPLPPLPNDFLLDKKKKPWEL